MTDPLAPNRLVPPTPGQLRRLMGAERLRPRKSLSQNFLTDPEALDAIVEAAELQPGDRVVEIGPGLGVLTRRLLAAGASVLAVEVDARLAEYLRRELYGATGFELIEADALSLHPREMFPGESFKVVANIPYHITSPLLHTFLEGDRPPDLTVLLVQLEVAERVAAPPGRMSYLSVFAQNVATAEVVARVPAGAFEPAPAVDSAVLRLRQARRPGRPGGGASGAVLPRGPGGLPPASETGAQRAQPRAPRGPRRRRGGAGRVRGDPRPAPADPDRRRVGVPGERPGSAAPVSAPLRLEAPAKLNLSLRVVGRRSDGLHELDSHFVLLELADRLLLLPGCSGLRVEGDGVADVPLGPDNLAWRGLAAGLDGAPELACLTLEKRIPVAAGLAGGSSDAAAAWRLGRRWVGAAERPDARDLEALAAIGADVPFFASGAAEARVTGIGETISALDPVVREVVLIHPPFGLLTRDVFAELRPEEWGQRENDLLAPARRLRPELDELFALVVEAGGEPRLTGSGPTIFHLADDAARAGALADRLAAAGLRVTHTRTRRQPATIEAIEEETE